ncbi:hypothetical protein Tco_0006142 [Tanacetum coccineum]
MIIEHDSMRVISEIHSLPKNHHATRDIHQNERSICDIECTDMMSDYSNIYDLLLEECVSKDVTCSYLHSLSDLNAYAELQCLYLHKVKECECLAQKLSKQTESVNKEVHNKLLKSFAKLENHSISLELALQQCKEQMKNNSVCKENGSNVFRKEREQYHEIQDLKAQMQDKNIAIRMYRIATTTTQNREPQLPHASRNTNPHVSKSSGVNHTTSVSRPQLKCYQVKDKIVQLILFIVDSGCTKHMTGNFKLLCNFVEKFLGTVCFGNDQFALILGYRYLNQGNVMIKRVYYVEGPHHNLFSVVNVCDADYGGLLFRKTTLFCERSSGKRFTNSDRGSDSTQYSIKTTFNHLQSFSMAKASPTQA